MEICRVLIKNDYLLIKQIVSFSFNVLVGSVKQEGRMDEKCR